MRPYVSPRIVDLASRHVVSDDTLQQRPFVLYDGDAQIDERKLDAWIQPKKAAGLKPDRLYELLKNSWAVVDFGMPGCERLVYEASLFGASVVTNDELNGVDEIDFPALPPVARIQGRNYSQLNDHLKLLYDTPNRGYALYANFRTAVRRQKVEFLRSIRRYFSDSAAFWIEIDISAVDGAFHGLWTQVMSVLIHLPLVPVSVDVHCRASETSIRTNEFISSWTKFYRFLELHYLSAQVFLNRKHCIPLSSAKTNDADERFRASSSAYWVQLRGLHAYVISEEAVNVLGFQCHVVGCPFVYRGAIVVSRAGKFERNFHTADNWSNNWTVKDLYIEKRRTLARLSSPEVPIIVEGFAEFVQWMSQSIHPFQAGRLTIWKEFIETFGPFS